MFSGLLISKAFSNFLSLCRRPLRRRAPERVVVVASPLELRPLESPLDVPSTSPKRRRRMSVRAVKRRRKRRCCHVRMPEPLPARRGQPRIVRTRRTRTRRVAVISRCRLQKEDARQRKEIPPARDLPPEGPNEQRLPRRVSDLGDLLYSIY